MTDPRYARHVVLPEVGPEGQRRLGAARVLVIGAGGLGSPVLQYLAAAGVGHLGVVEDDVVDVSNLQRQVLFTTPDVGRAKVAVAAERLRAMNPGVKVEEIPSRLTSANALALVRRYDIVVDASDNFPTRYLVNDACVLERKPDVYGAVLRFEGQVSVFAPTRGPCYRCLQPRPPGPTAMEDCATAGVLGVLPGVVGTLMANEVLKLILEIGEPLIGRLLLFDGLDANFVPVTFLRDASCAVCGDHPSVTKLIDYEAFCSSETNVITRDETPLSPQEVKRRLDAKEDFVLLDVREPYEYEHARIEGARLVPMRDVPNRLAEIPSDKEIVVHCHHGGRALRIADFLRSKGYPRVRIMEGGIAAWSEDVDPSVPTY